MKLSFSRWQIFIIASALVLTAAIPISPGTTTKNYTFDVSSTYGDRDTFDFTVPEGGCIIAQIKSWSRSGTSGLTAGKLALILNGSDRSEYYARTDGSATSNTPLWTSYSVTSTQASKIKKWTISVVNFTKSGTAKGTLNLEYPPSQTPCELKVEVSRTKGTINLSWVYTGKSFNGSFLIERSTDGRAWSVVSACSSTASVKSYSCSDIKLRSGSTYYYRACAITSGSTCNLQKNITPAKSVKVP